MKYIIKERNGVALWGNGAAPWGNMPRYVSKVGVDNNFFFDPNVANARKFDNFESALDVVLRNSATYGIPCRFLTIVGLVEEIKPIYTEVSL